MRKNMVSPITAQSVYEQFKKKEPNHPWNPIIELDEIFQNQAFTANPYLFILEHLVDYDQLSSRRSEGIPYYPLLIGLPKFNKNASPDLLIQIAQKNFKDNPQFDKIMEIFRSSLDCNEFIMRFEFGKRHAEFIEIAFALDILFGKSKRLEPYSVTQEDLNYYEIFE